MNTLESTSPGSHSSSATSWFYRTASHVTSLSNFILLSNANNIIYLLELLSGYKENHGDK